MTKSFQDLIKVVLKPGCTVQLVIVFFDGNSSSMKDSDHDAGGPFRTRSSSQEHCLEAHSQIGSIVLLARLYFSPYIQTLTLW